MRQEIYPRLQDPAKVNPIPNMSLLKEGPVLTRGKMEMSRSRSDRLLHYFRSTVNLGGLAHTRWIMGCIVYTTDCNRCFHFCRRGFAITPRCATYTASRFQFHEYSLLQAVMLRTDASE